MGEKWRGREWQREDETGQRDQKGKCSERKGREGTESILGKSRGKDRTGIEERNKGTKI